MGFFFNNAKTLYFHIFNSVNGKHNQSELKKFKKTLQKNYASDQYLKKQSTYEVYKHMMATDLH